MYQWDDLTTMILTKENSLFDYLFSYWRKLMKHLLSAEEALAYQMTLNVYLNITSEDKKLWRNSGYRKNNKFLRRLKRQIKHSSVDWMEFNEIHEKQYDCFRNTEYRINEFVYKFFLQTPEQLSANNSPS